MPRFAILRHDGPQGSHWDLLLETGGVLRAWSLPQPPQPGVEMTAEALPDHRLIYLEYEGPISGGRGTVTAWDRGDYRWVRQDDAQLVIQLSGQKLAGRAVLRLLPGQARQWQFSLAAI
jgi:hypothetical protein